MSAIRKSTSEQASSATPNPVHTLPAGCDAEKTGTIETVAGTVILRIRRWPWDNGAWTRHEALVETPRTKKEKGGYLSLGAVEDMTDRPVTDMLHAHLVASRFVQDAAHRSPRRRSYATDAPAVAPNTLPPAPGTGEAVTAGTPKPRGPVKTHESLPVALHAMIGAAGWPQADHRAPSGT